MNHLLTCILAAAALALGACSARTNAGLAAYGNDHRIMVYSGGRLVAEYKSNGKVFVEEQAGGYSFQNRETGLFVRVCGDIIVETMEN